MFLLVFIVLFEFVGLLAALVGGDITAGSPEKYIIIIILYIICIILKMVKSKKSNKKKTKNKKNSIKKSKKKIVKKKSKNKKKPTKKKSTKKKKPTNKKSTKKKKKPTKKKIQYYTSPLGKKLPKKNKIYIFKLNKRQNGELYEYGLHMVESVSKDYHKVLEHGDDIVIRKKAIKVLFSYPFSNPQVITFDAPNDKHFTRLQLLSMIAKQYQDIYKEEEETSKIKEATYDETYPDSGLLNRIPTDGKWGICNHVLGDLIIQHIKYNEKKRYYDLIVDS